jgi:hypothetical protein
VKEFELLLLNHEKCGRQRIWNYGTVIDVMVNSLDLSSGMQPGKTRGW